MAYVVDKVNNRDLGDITHPDLLVYYAGCGYEVDGRVYAGDDDAMGRLVGQIAGGGQPAEPVDEPAADPEPQLRRASGDPLHVTPAQ